MEKRRHTTIFAKKQCLAAFIYDLVVIHLWVNNKQAKVAVKLLSIVPTLSLDSSTETLLNASRNILATIFHPDNQSQHRSKWLYGYNVQCARHCNMGDLRRCKTLKAYSHQMARPNCIDSINVETPCQSGLNVFFSLQTCISIS